MMHPPFFCPDSPPDSGSYLPPAGRLDRVHKGGADAQSASSAAPSSIRMPLFFKKKSVQKSSPHEFGEL